MSNIVLSKKIKVLKDPVYTPIPDGIISQRIPFRADLIGFDAPAYTTDDSGNQLTCANLASYDGITTTNGIPSGVPVSLGIGIDMYGYKQLDWVSIGGSWKINFDLQGEWDLDYIYAYVVGGENNSGCSFAASQNGTDYVQLIDNFQSLNQGSWLKVPFTNIIGQASAKFLQLQINGYVMVVQALVLYGRPSGNKIIKGTKLSKIVPERNFDHATGTNGFWIEHAALMCLSCQTSAERS